MTYLEQVESNKDGRVLVDAFCLEVAQTLQIGAVAVLQALFAGAESLFGVLELVQVLKAKVAPDDVQVQQSVVVCSLEQRLV